MSYTKLKELARERHENLTGCIPNYIKNKRLLDAAAASETYYFLGENDTDSILVDARNYILALPGDLEQNLDNFVVDVAEHITSAEPIEISLATVIDGCNHYIKG